MDGAESLRENVYQLNCGQPVTSSSPAFVNLNHDGRQIEVQHGDSLYSISNTAGRSKTKENFNISNTEHEAKAKLRTTEMPSRLDDLSLSSPKERGSRSRSRGSSCRSRSSSRSSTSRSRSRSSRTRSRSASRSSSRGRYYSKRKYHRSSRSSSRSRSRSVSPRYRRYHPSRSHRRYYRSPPRYRSRSRSRSRGRAYYYRRYHSRSRSRSRSRGRRYYGFVRRAYPATFRSWRSRSRTRSRSRSHSPLRLTEKDRRELLEIAKANAAKALGKNVDLPPSLKMDPWFKEAQKKSIEADVAKTAKQSTDSSEVPNDVSPGQGVVMFNHNNTVAKPAVEKQCSSSTTKDEKRNLYGQWIPIQKEDENFSGSSPKNAYMPIR